MRAGGLDRRVTLREPSAGTDTIGQPTETWADAATVWAEVREIKGREYFEAAQVQAERTVTFRIRYRSDVTEKWRIVWNGTEYDIRALAEIGRREGLEIVGGVPSGGA